MRPLKAEGGHELHLRMSGIAKAFPGVQALDSVSLEVEIGEIAALVGVNGAGKSTLMNILGGVDQPDSGDIVVQGQRVRIHSPAEAARLGIAFIHQELVSFASQTVAENIFMSHLFPSPVCPLFVSKRTANERARRYIEMLGVKINPRSRLEELSPGERQVVEIARALAMNAQLVIFDEPTSSLSLREKTALFGVIRRLSGEGKSIIYITHFIEEVLELADTYVVLRTGRVHGTGRVRDVTKEDLIRMIIGRDLPNSIKIPSTASAKTVLEVERLRSGTLLKEVSFELAEGEVLGIWGLMGSGRTELIRAMLGLDPLEGGRVSYLRRGQLARIAPRQLLEAGGYVTENRHADGLFMAQPIWKNVTATTLGRYASRILRLLRTGAERATSREAMQTLRITGPGHEAVVAHLSGGNQQKVVFAKWLTKRPGVLVLDEPTRGVDVGAKLEIGGLIRNLAAQGTAVLLVTSEVEEMVSLSDRVLVLRDGRIVAALAGEDISSANLMGLALGALEEAG